MLEAANVDALVSRLTEMGGSDLHLKVGIQPMARVRGLLTPIEGHDRLQPEDTAQMLNSIIPPALVEEFERDG